MQMMAPTSFSELLLLGWVCECVGKCKFVCVRVCMCATVPNPRLAVALRITERKDWTSAHTLAWLHLWTKGSLWRTSCVRILVFVGMLERLFRSGDMTLGGSSSFVVFHPWTLSLFLIHSVVSCPLYLVVSAYFPVAQPLHSFPSCRLASLFHPPHHTPVQFLGLNSHCKATMPQLAPAAWDNYFSPLVHRVIFCHWYHDMRERTLMIFFSVYTATGACQSSPHWRFLFLECTLIILPSSLWNSNDLKNGWY